MKNFLKKNWYIILINFVLIVGVFVFNALYLHNWKNGVPNSIHFKFVSSSCFATLGLINLLFVCLRKRDKLNFSIAAAIALVLCMAGDVAIEYQFIAGAACFALGHVAFVISFYFLKKFHWLDLVCSFVFAIPAVLFLILFKGFTFRDEVLRYVCAIYAMIIGFMFGKSLSNLIQSQTKLNISIFVAATLFVVSDACLLMELFTPLDGTITGLCCMAIYCPALVLLGSLIYFRD